MMTQALSKVRWICCKYYPPLLPLLFNVISAIFIEEGGGGALTSLRYNGFAANTAPLLFNVICYIFRPSTVEDMGGGWGQ